AADSNTGNRLTLLRLSVRRRELSRYRVPRRVIGSGSITTRPGSIFTDTVVPSSKPACSSTQRPSTRMQGYPARDRRTFNSRTVRCLSLGGRRAGGEGGGGKAILMQDLR